MLYESHRTWNRKVLINREGANVRCSKMYISYEGISKKHNFEITPHHNGTGNIFPQYKGTHQTVPRYK